jgi:hypothetical protein
MSEKERGIIVHTGMGGFLCPPTHPMHSMSVQTDLRRRPENRGGMSLETAVSCEYLEDSTREAARRILRGWERLPIDHPDVVDWIRQVLGYFRHCYRNPDVPETEQWNAGQLLIVVDSTICNPTNHAGVHLIRKYYPIFNPSSDDWRNAYWGKKSA